MKDVEKKHFKALAIFNICVSEVSWEAERARESLPNGSEPHFYLFNISLIFNYRWHEIVY